MRVGGIYKPNPLVGSFVVGDGFFLSHFDNPLPIARAAQHRPGAADLEPGAQPRARRRTPTSTIKTRAQFEQSQQNSVNQLLGLVYVLLALAILVALIGIVNTLMLSVFERTREIGLLRAVGMKRRQVRAMIRSESVIVALFGAVVGIVIGTGLGIALASSLRNNGVTTIAVPIASLIGFLVLSGAARPGRGHLAGAPGRQPRRAGGDRERVTPTCRGGATAPPRHMSRSPHRVRDHLWIPAYGGRPRAAGRDDHRVAGDRERRVRRCGQPVAIDDRAGAPVERDQHAVVEGCEDEIVGDRGGAERQSAAPSCPTRPCRSRG